MNLGLLTAFVAGTALLAHGIVFGNTSGSGVLVTQQMPIPEFTKVQAGNSFRITISLANRFNVAIKTDDNLVDHLDVKKSGNTQVVGLKFGRSTGKAALEADVSMPELTSVRLSGASRGIVRGFASAGKFDARLSGASSLSGDIEAVSTDVELSKSSSVDLKASSNNLILKASGASNAAFQDLIVGSAEVNLSGASTATINAKDSIGPASLSESSNLFYLGNPTIQDVHTSGGSSINARE